MPLGIGIGLAITRGAGVGGVVFNYNPAYLSNWFAAVAAYREGGVRPVIACPGDSKTTGQGAGSGDEFIVGAAPLGWPSQLASMLTTMGLPAVDNSWFGVHGFGSIADLLAYDERLTGFTGYSRNTAIFSLGGAQVFTSTIGNSASFQPTNTVDHFDIYSIAKAGDATYTITQGADATVLATVDANLSARLLKTTVEVTRGLTKVNVQKLSGASGNSFIGIVGWDSVSPAVEISNMGASGSKSGDWNVATNGYAALPALGTYAPDLTILNLGSNDLAASVSVGTWSANMQAIITKAKLSGDVILLWPAVGNSTGAGTNDQRVAYKNELRALAVANNCIMVDFEQLLGGRVAAQAAGYFADGLHETAAAYEIEAQKLAELIYA